VKTSKPPQGIQSEPSDHSRNESNTPFWFEHMPPASAAEYVNLSPSLMAKMRMKSDPRRGPPFIKIGKSVLYRKCDLDSWLESHIVHKKHSAQ